MKRRERANVHFKHGLAAAVVCLCAAPALAQAPASPTAAPKPAATAKKVAAKPTTPPLSGPGSLNGVWNPLTFKTYRTGPPGDAVRAAEEARVAAEHPNVRPPGPPFQPWAQAIADQKRKEAAALTAAGKPPAGGGSQCMTGGMPGSMNPPSEDVLQFVETPDQKQITVLFEFYGTFRIIHMNEKHPDDPDPTYMGNSVGHWEGGTLVVDTIAFSDKVANTGGVPHSDDLHLIEHIRRVDKDTLEDRQTTIDPKVFTKPWDRVITLKMTPGLKIREWECENQRNGVNADGSTAVQLQGSKS